MSFTYTRSAHDKARSGLLFAAVAIPFTVGLLYLTVDRGHYLAAAIVGFLGLIALFGSIMGVIMAVALLRAGGSWRIEVTETLLKWKSPSESVDPSFEIALEDIDYILVEVEKVRPDGTDDVDDYFLVRNDGRALKLNKVSGVRLEALVQALADGGVRTERHLGRVRIQKGRIERRPPKRSRERASA